MLKENLVILRNIHSYSQEEIAEKINISRQAYAKWETGATVPDIEKCSLLAAVYGVTIDSLIKTETAGTAKVGEKGQIVIPKDARDKFGLTGGTRLIVLSDEEGIALVPAERFERSMKMAMEFASMQNKAD